MSNDEITAVTIYLRELNKRSLLTVGLLLDYFIYYGGKDELKQYIPDEYQEWRASYHQLCEKASKAFG